MSVLEQALFSNVRGTAMRKFLIVMLALPLVGCVTRAEAPKTTDPSAFSPRSGQLLRARPLKVGYVDLTRVLKAYQRRQDMEDEFRKQQASLNRDAQSRVDEVKRLRGELQQLARGTPERLELEEKAKAAYMALDRTRLEHRKTLNVRLGSMLRELHGDVVRKVEIIGREGGYDFILKNQSFEKPASGHRQTLLQISQQIVLYSKPEYDISDMVIKRLNEKYALK